MKKKQSSLVALVVGTTLCTSAYLFTATYSSADVQSSPTPAPSVASTSTPTQHQSASSPRRAAIKAANQVYMQSVISATQGRDLALADATATLNQSLAAAGKDGAARKAAWSAYKLQVSAVREAFKQAMAAANDARAAAISAAPAPSPTK